MIWLWRSQTCLQILYSSQRELMTAILVGLVVCHRVLVIYNLHARIEIRIRHCLPHTLSDLANCYNWVTESLYS